MRLTITQDTCFFISDEIGDVPLGTELGYYAEDTRFLSCYHLTLDTSRPIPLASRVTENAAATYFLMNPVLAQAPRGTLGVRRQIRLAAGFDETLTVTNYGEQTVMVDVALAYEADFGHVFEVKSEVEVDPAHSQRHGETQQTRSADGRTVQIEFVRGNSRRTVTLAFSQTPVHGAGFVTFPLKLAPHAEWQVQITLTPQIQNQASGQLLSPAQHHTNLKRVSLFDPAPSLKCNRFDLILGYERALKDMAALTMPAPDGKTDDLIIAAGIPWFMTLFGRDSIITALQVLPFFPDLARGVLRTLARMQGTRVDPLRCEEPGKILHEYRSPNFIGTEENPWLFPYYGTIDATPLFVMLLGAYYQATGDEALVRDLYPAMEGALQWMDRYGDRDGDGYLEYHRENAAGLANQGWKDSGDSIRYHDGTLAPSPIALTEVQGYAYAARLAAAQIAEAFGDILFAQTQRDRAAQLKARFNRDFWMEDAQFFAEGLDAGKKQITAVTSNPGHLLFCGILDQQRAEQVARRLMEPDMFSGWGIRTMGTREGGYNPISYHCGSVWPHDNSLILAGMARYGLYAEASKLAEGLFAALALYPDYRFPELFAGFGRNETAFPVDYPTACSPQAWASGTVLLVLASMLGIDVLDMTNRKQPWLIPGVDHLELIGLQSYRLAERIDVQRDRANIVTS